MNDRDHDVPALPALLRLGLTMASARRTLLVGLATLLLAGVTGLLRIEQDASILSLIEAGHPARQLHERLQQTFHLHDALVVVLSTPRPGGAVEPASLEFLETISRTLKRIEGIDPGRVASLVDQDYPIFDAGELRMQALTAPAPDAARQLEQALVAAPVFDGLLVSADRSATLIAATLRAGADGGRVYAAARRALDRLPAPPGVQVHVAGDAAVTGFLSRYIERDALVLTPLAVVLSLLILAAYLRHPAALLPGAAVITGTLAVTVGAMGWAGCAIYVITSSLPAILVCVSVADCIHLSHGVSRHRADPACPDPVLAGLRDTFRPMLLTTLTTMAGFAGIALGSSNAPMREFGLFAALGTGVAFVFSVTVVPMLLHRWPQLGGRRRSPGRTLAIAGPGRPWQVLSAHPRACLLLVTGLCLAGAGGLNLLVANEERIRNFAPQSPVRQADQLINRQFAGSRALDLVLVAARPGALVEPEVIERVRNLQVELAARGLMHSPHSYVDLIDTMTRAAAEGAEPAPVTDADAVEQWLFLYELAGARTAVDDRLSPARNLAYIRGFRATDNYRELAPVAARIQRLAEQHLEGSGIHPQLAGPGALVLPLFEPVLPDMLFGAGMALLLVALASGLVLGSAWRGLLCMLPVSMSLLTVFGVMGWTGVWLDVATAMMASIAIGLGVDFAIYTQHAAVLARRAGLRGHALAASVYARVASPLSANTLILAIGFSVTALSSIPPVRHFGLLVAASVLAAALSALLTLPAIHALASGRQREPQPAPGLAL